MDNDTAESTAQPAWKRIHRVAAGSDGLVLSCEPAVVFASLARSCVPEFSDSCTVNIVEEGHGYRIEYPSSPHVPFTRVGPNAIHTRFESVKPSVRTYSGVIVHSWLTHEPTPADVEHVELLVRYAVSLIDRERIKPDPDRSGGAIDLMSQKSRVSPL